MKAIETKYDGYLFRSRLEARFAVFFNALGIKYMYEKEGYDLDNTWYLPDFWLPEQEIWIEIKGQEPTESEKSKCALLACKSGYPVYILAGNIGIDKNEHKYPEWKTSYTGQFIMGGAGDTLVGNYTWAECDDCQKIGLVPHWISDGDLPIGLTADYPFCLCYKKYLPVLPPSFMTPEDTHIQDIMARLTQLGIHLSPSPISGQIKFRAPKGVMTEEIINELRTYKKDILEHLQHSDTISRMTIKEMEQLVNYLRLGIDHYSDRLIAAYTAARQARFEHR